MARLALALVHYISAKLSRPVLTLTARVDELRPAGEHWWRNRLQATARRSSQPFALTLLVLQPLVFFERVLFNPSAHIPFDIAAFHLPLTAYIARCVRQGILPLWDPYRFCGVPIHADVTAQLFYPFTWISIVLGNLSAGHRLFYWLEWLVPLHMILAGLFTYALLKQLGISMPAALLGGTAFQLSGFFASQTQHLGAICSAAWLPLALLCVVKLMGGVTARWTAVLALSIALNVLSGFPATTFVTLGAVALLTTGFSIQRKVSWRCGAALLAGLALGYGIAAVQVIPAYQLTRLSIASMRSSWLISGGGLRWQSLASLVVPNYYHIFTPFDRTLFKVPTNFTFLYVYCGLIPLGLVIAAPFLRAARNARMLFLLTVLSALWMLGDETPVYRFVYSHLPSLLRGALYAEFALLAFSMFAALAAAVSLHHLTERVPALAWGVVFLTAADLIYFGANRAMNSMPGGYKQESSEYEVSRYPGDLARIRSLVEFTNPPSRVDYLDIDHFTFIWGASMLEVPTPTGNNPFMSKRLYLLRRIFGCGYPWERNIPVCRPASPLVRMLNVGFLAGHSVKLPDRTPAADLAGLELYRVSDPLPRFYFVPTVQTSVGVDETFSRLARSGFDPAREAVVETGQPLDGKPFAGGIIRVEDYSPNRVALTAVVTGPAFLASSEPLYPGWTATVNGAPAAMYMTNGAFRGIVLDQGVNRIVMSYWPERFLLWAAISTASLLVAIAGLFFGRPLRAETGTI